MEAKQTNMTENTIIIKTQFEYQYVYGSASSGALKCQAAKTRRADLGVTRKINTATVILTVILTAIHTVMKRVQTTDKAMIAV